MLKNKGGLIPAIVLVVICALTAGLLSWTNMATAENIANQKAEKDDLARKALLVSATTFEEVSKDDFLSKYPNFSDDSAKKDDASRLLSIYKGLSSDKQVVGYIVEGAYRGYGGDVPAMVGVLIEGKISKVKVLTNDETPGLGKKVEADAFLKQFENADVKKPFAIGEANADEIKLDTVSGATMSSRGVQRTVNLAMKIFNETGKEGLK